MKNHSDFAKVFGGKSRVFVYAELRAKIICLMESSYADHQWSVYFADDERKVCGYSW